MIYCNFVMCKISRPTMLEIETRFTLMPLFEVRAVNTIKNNRSDCANSSTLQSVVMLDAVTAKILLLFVVRRTR